MSRGDKAVAIATRQSKLPFSRVTNPTSGLMKMVDKSSKLDKFSANMGVSGTVAGGSGGGGGCGSGVNSGFTTGASGLLQTGVGSQNGQKPVPMKLFAAWEVDRTPPNCMPR